MGSGRTIFEILRTEQDSAADAALLASLEDADLPIAQAIVETLLTRNTKEGMLGLVQSFHLLDESLRQAVLIDWDRLFSVLREAAQSRTEQTRINVMEVIRRACIYRAAYLVETCLRSRSTQVRVAAGKTLFCLADELMRTAPVPVRNADLESMGPDEIRQRMVDLESYVEDRRQVVSSLEAALSCYEVHQQPLVVEAALWFVDDASPTFWAVMSAPGSKVAGTAGQVLSKGISARLVPFAIHGLSFSEFRPRVLKALADGGDPEFLAEWLRQSWRLAQPKTARIMGSIRLLACTNEYGKEALALPPASQRHLARWIACTGLGVREKLEFLQEMLYQTGSDARRSALWMLTSFPDMQVHDTLRSFNHPEEPELEQIARRELARRCPLEVPIGKLLHEAGKSWADQGSSTADSQEMSFDRYWTLFDGMTERQRIEAGKHVLETTPLVYSVLGRRLTANDLLERVRAVRVICALELTERFEEKLYQLCHDPRPEMRSAAVAALAPLKSPVSRRLLHNALQDTDTRVQANAVESLAALGSESLAEELIDKLSSPDNRVQANAVKALLKLGVREAAETLLRMLQHENRTHRISALWLIERMGLFTLATRVTGLASSDPDPAVRRRALALSDGLPGTVVPGSKPPAAPAAKAAAPSVREVPAA